MSLELHIWGPAFGLPSIDPDCLGAVTYFSLAVPRHAWTVVATSPSAISKRLPALRDGQSGRWLASGFEDIVTCMRQRLCHLQPADSQPRSSGNAGLDLDADLTPLQTADSTALCAFLHAEAAPLLALSLYVSSANWSATTRPAYSHLLPFPLTWIEPPAIRAAQSARAAHLGLSSLDTDREEDEQGSSGSGAGSGITYTSLTAAARQVFPDRLRATSDGASTSEQGAQKKKTSLIRTGATVSAALTPEARAQIRLDGAARACLSVLAKRKGDKRLFLRPDRDPAHDSLPPSFASTPSSLDCLAFGYLALMLVPDVPRPFLRDALRRHYPDLAVFVADMRQAAFGEGGGSTDKRLATPPSAASPSSLRGTNPLWLRTVHGLVHSIPGLSGEWIVWLYSAIRTGDDGDPAAAAVTKSPWQRDVAVARRQRLVALCASLTGTVLTVGFVLGFRSLPPFGAPVIVYQRLPQASVLGLGAAGAFLSSL